MKLRSCKHTAFWCLVFTAVLSLCSNLNAEKAPVGAEASTETPPNESEKRVLWTTSRLVGSPDPPPPYTVQRAFPHLKFNKPIHLLLGPEQQRYFLSEYDGRIVSFTNSQNTKETAPFLELKIQLFSLAFHPRFQQNPYVYVFGNTSLERKEGVIPHNQILRFEITKESPPRAILDSRQVILEYDSDGHNGGEAKFGPDGYLYISSGDGSSDSDAWNTGQDVSDLPGSILRIDIDHPDPELAYGIPEDNPLLDVKGARGELWAYGFRNPWRFSFDSANGNLYAGDVGQDLWEMIFLVHPGGNYGWSVKEGNHDFHPFRKRGPTPIVGPLVEHHHTESRSITGGYVYHGSRFPELEGAYLYGDHETGKIWGLRHQDKQISWHQELADVSLKIASFGVGAAGEIFLIEHQSGELHQLIRAPNTSNHPPFPQRLSETGLFASLEPLIPATGLIPYTVNSPQWMDGAAAQRYLGLPDESQITFERSGSWKFTDGAVLVKTVLLPSERPNLPARRIETQILTLQAGEWQGYSYLWNDQQTDATLVPAKGTSHMVTLEDPATPDDSQPQPWRIVSRSECMVCHSRASGYILGLNTAQLNHDNPLASGHKNQLSSLEQRGAFTEPLPETLENLPRLANPYDPQAALSTRARSYLHANCSHCHVGAGGGNAKIVLTSQTKLAETFLVGGRPLHADFGIAGAMLVAPGDPERSVLYQRVSRRGNGQMPPLASGRMDRRASRMLRQWIEQIEVPESARQDVDLAFAGIQGASGALSRWYMTGPLDQNPVTDTLSHLAKAPDTKDKSGTLPTGEDTLPWNSIIGRGAECRVQLTAPNTTSSHFEWLARTDIRMTEACDIQLSTDSSESMRIWLNGELLTPSGGKQPWVTGSKRFDSNLQKGSNRILVEVLSSGSKGAQFMVNFRRKSSNPRHEQFAVAALSLAGNADRGQSLFFNTLKGQCIKCHRIEHEGGQVGPELTGVGSRLSTARLIESILDPSRTVAPDYRAITIELNSGRILTGILINETPTAVTIKNDQAEKLILSKSKISLMQIQPTSLMPAGLEKSITQKEFVDLIAYLKQLTTLANTSGTAEN